MAQALYRKYRSRSFDELVGQKHVTRTLEQAVKQGKISHAYLFTGPRGVGKTSIARILAHVINGLEYSDKPHLDIIEIDAASNRRIEDVRDLREKVQIAPVSATYKVYIIDEVHMLTNESFNALLKTLEEPPSHVVFILATTELYKLPATITSRTQRFAFAPPSREMIARHLAGLAKQEKIDIDSEAVALLAEHADGSFRDSISLLDQVSTAAPGSNTITEQDIANLLGLPPKSTIESLLQATLTHQPSKVAETVAQLTASGISASTVAVALIRQAVDVAPSSPASARLLDALLSVPRHSYPEAKLLAVLLEVAHHGAAPTAQAPAPKPKSVPLQATAPQKQEVAKSDQSPPRAPTASGPVTERWGEVLAQMQAHSAPLRGTLKNAEVRLGSDNTKVILAFKYGLHAKKIEGSKHKGALAAALQTVLGTKDVTVEAIVDPNAVPTPATIPPPPADPTATAIMDVMGGGEMVHYK